MGEFKELTRIEKVREFRIATRSGLKTAIEAVEAGWNPGDPIDHELTARMDEEYAKQARIRNAAPALLEALQSAALNLDACAVAIKKGGKSEGRHILAEGWAERARAAIASALGEA